MDDEKHLVEVVAFKVNRLRFQCVSVHKVLDRKPEQKNKAHLE